MNWKPTAEYIKAEYEKEYTRTCGKTVSICKSAGWWTIVSPANIRQGVIETKMREAKLLKCLASLKTRPDWVEPVVKPLFDAIDPFVHPR